MSDEFNSLDEKKRLEKNELKRVMVVTGTRAEFGILRPVMYAIHEHESCELRVVVSGSHLVQPAVTFREVKAEFGIADSVPMQTAGKVGRLADVESLGKGIARFGRSMDLNEPDCVVVLGDRIEAFAAASAASIGGYPLVHIHGGDRAEGVADEAMRHAITKLAHVHFPASELSAQRIIKMGEDPSNVHMVGSPAVDGLDQIPMMGDGAYMELGSPEIVVLMHPIGMSDELEKQGMLEVLSAFRDQRVLVLHPNLDPGRRGIMEAIECAPIDVQIREGMPRGQFVGLLKRGAQSGGALVGNSSAGLIEAAAIGCPSVDLGDRQSGRERCEGWTVHSDVQRDQIVQAYESITRDDVQRGDHPYGDGSAGDRIAQVIGSMDWSCSSLIRKKCMY